MCKGKSFCIAQQSKSYKTSCYSLWFYMLLDIGLELIFKRTDSEFMKIAICILIAIFTLNIVIVKNKILHDMNSSGWWVLAQLIPVLGIIFALALFIAQSCKGENYFGPTPEKARTIEYIMVLLYIPLIILFSAIVYTFNLNL